MNGVTTEATDDKDENEAARWYQIGRVVSAVILVADAIRHGVLLATTQVGQAKHGLFLVLNIGLAVVLIKRPRWAFWPTILITVEELATHGLSLSASFLGTAPLDKIAIAVCLFWPTLATILYLERTD